ncbi:hypothetical protein KCU98_g5967, partial [Aureobasidium melanogenum]
MSTSCSYDTTSLFSLRSQAISPLLPRCASAERLNLWVPTAQQNKRGHTQPFPFDHYVHGIGSIITTPNHINEIFADMSSWDTPSEEPWAVAEVQPTPSSVGQNMALAITDAAEAVAASEPTNGVTEEAPADAAPSATGEVRKSSLADLANGDRDAVVAHLAKRLGPHKFLARSSTISQKSDTEPNAAALTTNGHVPNTEVSEPDGAASVVDDSTSIASTNAVATKDESTQTAPDTDASKLFRATPASSVTDGDKSVVQSPNLSPLSVRKPGPHHRLKALTLAQDIPLPQSPAPTAKSSTSDEGPTTPVASAIELEPVVIQDTPPAPPVTIDDGNESDTSRVIITEFPNSLSDKEKTLDPKAEAWVPDDAVNPLPPSRPESPVSVTHNSETVYINECCPVPSEWSVPTEIGSSAELDLFDGPTIGGVHKTVLAHYSHYFATAFASQTLVKEGQFGHVVNSPSFTLFRKWIFGRRIYATSLDGAVHCDMDIDLKVLVRLWRFAARIQAPLFANTIADVMVNKPTTADEIFDAADEIDAVLQMVSVNNTFRLLINQVVIFHGIQLDDAQYEKWLKSHLWSNFTSQTHPCIYHLHSLGRTCMSE